MKNVKISVIVPIYNTEQYIRQCIDSIINQTYTNLEIILVDDGSPDNCGQICDEYAEQDNRVKVIHKSNGGHVSARKSGVAVATGDYITFVDSDDWIDYGAYSCAAEIIEAHNADVFVFGFKKIYEASLNCEHENIAEGFYDRNLIYKAICKINSDEIFYKKIISPFCCNKVIKADIVKNNIDNVDNTIKISEDAALMYPILFDSESIYITHTAHYNYRMNNNSILHRFDMERHKSVNKVVRSVYNAVKKQGLSDNRVIMQQLNLYSLDLMLITDASYFFDDLSELYPELKENNRIAVYGKGVYAQSLTFLANKNNKYVISGYFDSSSLDELDSMEYDYIIIAVTVSSFVEEMLETLRVKNIPSEKILYLRNNYMEQIGIKKMAMINE